MQNTFVAIKPDGTSRKLVGKIIQKFEDLNLNLIGLELMQVSRELAEKHYGEHKGKPFFEDLIQFITSGKIVAMAWQGKNSIEVIRKIVGVTDPLKAAPGSIRGDFALDISQNIIHASDGPESAARELKLFFPNCNFN